MNEIMIVIANYQTQNLLNDELLANMQFQQYV